MPRRLLFSVFGLTIAASGCATYDSIEGPYYPTGFTDGCRTAEARQTSFSNKEYRDLALFRTETSYRAGWRSGYQQCDRTQDIDNRPGDLGERDPL